MQRLKYILIGVVLALTALCAAPPVFGEQSGTLVLHLMNYTSDTNIPKNNRKALEHSGIQWGMSENTLLISFVAQNFIKAEIPYITRFGEQRTLELKPGRYTITCIGYQFNSTSSDRIRLSRSPLSLITTSSRLMCCRARQPRSRSIRITLLSRSGAFGQSSNCSSRNSKYACSRMGHRQGDDLVVNRRTDKSVAWDDYHGPLKFRPSSAVPSSASSPVRKTSPSTRPTRRSPKKSSPAKSPCASSAPSPEDKQSPSSPLSGRGNFTPCPSPCADARHHVPVSWPSPANAFRC